jgi:hypothetical protein
VIEGNAVAAIHDGELEGAVNMRHPRIRELVDRVLEEARRASRPTDRIAIAADGRLPSSVLAATLLSARSRELRGFDLVVGGGRDETVLPIELPRPKPKRPPTMPDAPDEDVGLLVSISGPEVVLWSTSGLEGTLRAPKLRVPLAPAAERTAALRKALADIVARRGKKGSTLIVISGRDVTVQTLVELFAAVRAGDDGTELFPDALLGMPL